MPSIQDILALLGSYGRDFGSLFQPSNYEDPFEMFMRGGGTPTSPRQPISVMPQEPFRMPRAQDTPYEYGALPERPAGNRGIIRFERANGGGFPVGGLRGGFGLPSDQIRPPGGGLSIGGDLGGSSEPKDDIDYILSAAANEAILAGQQGRSPRPPSGLAALAEVKERQRIRPLEEEKLKAETEAFRERASGKVTGRDAFEAFSRPAALGDTKPSGQELLAYMREVNSGSRVTQVGSGSRAVEVPQEGAAVPSVYEKMPTGSKKELSAVDDQGHMIVSHDGGATWYTSPGNKRVR